MKHWKIYNDFSGVMTLTTSTAFSHKIVDHRVASHFMPENAVLSVELGYELGADLLGIDVQVTKDGKVIVNRDHTPREHVRSQLYYKKHLFKRL